MPKINKKTRLKYALANCFVLAAMTMSGCATTAVKYNADNIDIATDRLLRPQAEALDVEGPLNIDQVRNRTLTHNSDYARAQTQLVETVRKAGKRGKDLLPQVYASSYGSWRNNASASVGKKVDDTSSTMPQDFYTAQDRAVAISNFTTSWNLLEIGLSGFKANRRAINAYSETEQNQYLCNKLMVDVENAYWRAVAFEQAEKKANWLKSRVTYALDLSQQRANAKPETKLQELMFQRELIDINRWYQSLYRSLISAKPDLARLMNLPAGTNNTNSFDLNSNFASAGASLSWDLLRMGQIGKTKRNGKINFDNDKLQTEILASAIMAQVMISREQMHKLDYDLSLAWKALFIQGEITDDLAVDVASGEKPETYLVKEELMRELSYIREQMARAELHTAKARLQQSIGVVPTCKSPEEIPTLTVSAPMTRKRS